MGRFPYSFIAILLILGVLGLIPLLHLYSPFSYSKALPGFSLENHAGDIQIYSSKNQAASSPERGLPLAPGDRIVTGDDSEAEITLPDQIRLRLKNNSELIFCSRRQIRSGQPAYSVRLMSGAVFASVPKNLGHDLEFNLNTLVGTLKQGLFFASNSATHAQSFLGVLRGSMLLYTPQGPVQTLNAMKKIMFTNHQPASIPEKIGMSDWRLMREAYELVSKTAASEARQMDLSKQAGNFFDYVLDHGTFFTPNLGFADREFFENPDDNNDIVLQAEYDVFPTGSFVGVYFKTRDLNLSKFQAIRFEARKAPEEEGVPSAIRLEMKGKNGLLRAFAPRHFVREWQTFEYPLNFKNPEALRELAFVFHHDRVGTFTKGFLQFRNFTLVPQTKKAEEPLPENETPEDEDTDLNPNTSSEASEESKNDLFHQIDFLLSSSSNRT